MNAASITGRSNVLRTRLEELTEREAMLLEALQQTRAELGQTREQMADTERARARVKAPRRGRSAIAEETWRRVVRELRTFTVSELATELGCTKPVATRHLKTMIEIGMVAPAGRVLGKALYEYARPTDEGDAFRVQQRHLIAVPEVVATEAPERGTVAGVSKSRGAGMIADKEMRKAVQAAINRGWTLRKKGDGHFVLTKGTRRVSVAGSPKSGTDSADLVRRMTR